MDDYGPNGPNWKSGKWLMYNRLSQGGTGRVAQLGEHLLCKQGVRGSNPLTSTNFLKFIKSGHKLASARQRFGHRATGRQIIAIAHDHRRAHQDEQAASYQSLRSQPGSIPLF